MFKCKSLPLLFLLVFSLVFTAGCSQSEQGLLQLLNEMGTLEVHETSGDFSFSLKGLPTTDDMSPLAALMQNLIEQEITATFTSKTDLNKQLLTSTFTFHNLPTASGQVTSELICQGDTLYLQVDEIVNFIQSLGDSALNQQLTNTLGENKYISMSMNEYLGAFNAEPVGNVPLMGLPSQSFLDQEQTVFWQKIMTCLPQAFANYDSGLVTWDGDAYTWELTGNNIPPFLLDFLHYTLNNLPDIAEAILAFFDNLTEEELALCGLEPEAIDFAPFLISIALATVEESRDEIMADLETSLAALTEEQETQEFLDSLKLSFSLGQDSTGTYTSTQKYSFNLDPISFQLDTTSTTKAINSFNVVIPASEVVSLSAIQNALARTLVITVAEPESTYSLSDNDDLSTGRMSLLNIDGFTYLPMRQIAELLGEEVGWDTAESQAYVVRNERIIPLTGVIIDGRTYLKTRDFTELGYQVDWDAATQEITIIANIF